MIKCSRILKARGYSCRAWVRPDLTWVMVHGDDDEDLHEMAAQREGFSYVQALDAGWVKVGLQGSSAYVEYDVMTDAQLHIIQKYFMPIHPKSVEVIPPLGREIDFDPAETFYMLNHVSDIVKKRAIASRTAALSGDDILKHVKMTNPHSGPRDALAGMSDPRAYTWEGPVEIQPNDPRILRGELAPASRRDVERYMKKYKAGSPFPPIVLTVMYTGKFAIQDGAHRLQAAIYLGVPIMAYIGTKNK